MKNENSITAVRKFSPKSILLRYGLYIGLLLLFCYFSIVRPNFFTVRNLLNILDQFSYYIIGAIGMMFVILVGGIDLSSGAMVALASVLGTMTMIRTRNILLACLLMLVICTVSGLINGLSVARIGIPAFVVTLAFENIWRGVAYTLTFGDTLSGLPSAFTRMYFSKFLGINFSIVVMLLVIAAAAYILHFSSFGKSLYAVGSNAKAARVMGIPTKRITVLAYGLAGLFVGISTIIVTSYIGSARAATAVTLSLDCIAAVIIGGASVTGGEGKLAGTVVGALLFAMVKNGLNLLGLSYFWQLIVTGVIIYVAVSIDRLKVRAGL